MILTWTHVIWLAQDYRYLAGLMQVCVSWLHKRPTRLPKTAGHWHSALMVLWLLLYPQGPDSSLQLPKTPVSAVRVIPIHCLLHWGVRRLGGTAYFIIAFQSYHQLHFTRVATHRARMVEVQRKPYHDLKRSCLGTWCWLTSSLLRKTAWGDEKIKTGTVKRGICDGWNTIGIADHFAVFQFYALVWFLVRAGGTGGGGLCRGGGNRMI